MNNKQKEALVKELYEKYPYSLRSNVSAKEIIYFAEWVARVFGETKEYWKGKNTSEVLLQVNLAARELKDFKSLSRQQQKSLLDFCCNLSTEVGRNYQEYYARTSKLAA